MAKFAAMITFGDLDTVAATRPTHREYLKELLAAGKLYASGPFVDGSGALIIYEAADEAEARRLIADDPYTAAGCLANVDLKEWNRVLAAAE